MPKKRVQSKKAGCTWWTWRFLHVLSPTPFSLAIGSINRDHQVVGQRFEHAGKVDFSDIRQRHANRRISTIWLIGDLREEFERKLTESRIGMHRSGPTTFCVQIVCRTETYKRVVIWLRICWPIQNGSFGTASWQSVSVSRLCTQWYIWSAIYKAANAGALRAIQEPWMDDNDDYERHRPLYGRDWRTRSEHKFATNRATEIHDEVLLQDYCWMLILPASRGWVCARVSFPQCGRS
jgi:hypothetical protein